MLNFLLIWYIHVLHEYTVNNLYNKDIFDCKHIMTRIYTCYSMDFQL